MSADLFIALCICLLTFVSLLVIRGLDPMRWGKQWGRELGASVGPKSSDKTNRTGKKNVWSLEPVCTFSN